MKKKKTFKRGDLIRRSNKNEEDAAYNAIFFYYHNECSKFTTHCTSMQSVYLVLDIKIRPAWISSRDEGHEVVLLLDSDGFIGWCESEYFKRI